MIYASERTPLWPNRYYVAGMDRVRQELRQPAVWLIPLVVLAIQLVGSTGPRHRAGHVLHWAPLNWFGYFLLCAASAIPSFILLAYLQRRGHFEALGSEKV